MLFKNKIKAIFKAIWRIFIVLVGILLVIALSLEIGVKPPIMQSSKKRYLDNSSTTLENDMFIQTSGSGYFGWSSDNEGITNVSLNFVENNKINFTATFSAVKTAEFWVSIDYVDLLANSGLNNYYLIGAYYTPEKYAAYFEDNSSFFEIKDRNYKTIINNNLYQYTNLSTLFIHDTATFSSGTIKLTFKFDRSTSTSTSIKFDIYLFAYNLKDFYTQSYNEGYTSGQNEVLNNANDYDLYNKEQYNNAYQQGYNEGVEASSNPYSGFNNSKMDIYFYQNDNESIYYSLENENISISDYNYFKLFDYIRVALSEYHSEGYTTEYIYVYIYDFEYFSPELYELLIQGFVKAVIVHDRGEEEIIDIGDPNSEDKIKLELSGDITDILLYVEPNYNLSNYNLGFSYYNNFENGYKSGYANGNKNGKNEVIDNPNKYGLYSSEQYQNHGEGKYQQGYNEGIRQEAPTGLEWFKSAVSVTLSFLDIMILPNVKLIHILSGFIILTILKWVLDWFRG